MLLFRQSDLQFLSTLSLRRATGGKQSFIRMDRIFLSTLSLRRATGLAGKVEDAINISIHALLAESDRGAGADRGGPVPHFYPRSPCGERHLCPGAACSNKLISIHALLAESDPARCGIIYNAAYFYPRSPCGERQQAGPPLYRVQDISIHALLAESDAIVLIRAATQRIFLSTLSLRRATASNLSSGKSITISIHALLAESDRL